MGKRVTSAVSKGSKSFHTHYVLAVQTATGELFHVLYPAEAF